MRVEVAVLGSPSLIVWSVSVDIKQQLKKTILGALELCEGRGGRPTSPYKYNLCGRKATLNLLSIQSSGAV